MFGLLSGAYEYLTRKEEYHILIVGIDNAGKSNLLEKLKTLFSGEAGRRGRVGASRALGSLRLLLTGLCHPRPLPPRSLPAWFCTARLPADHLGLEASKIMPTVGLNVGRAAAFGATCVFWDLVGARHVQHTQHPAQRSACSSAAQATPVPSGTAVASGVSGGRGVT
jgi:hypothetical protein